MSTKKGKKCALPGNRTRVARMGILHDTTTLAVLTLSLQHQLQCQLMHDETGSTKTTSTDTLMKNTAKKKPPKKEKVCTARESNPGRKNGNLA